jgi:hypothetical protein
VTDLDRRFLERAVGWWNLLASVASCRGRKAIIRKAPGVQGLVALFENKYGLMVPRNIVMMLVAVTDHNGVRVKRDRRDKRLQRRMYRTKVNEVMISY